MPAYLITLKLKAF